MCGHEEQLLVDGLRSIGHRWDESAIEAAGWLNMAPRFMPSIGEAEGDIMLKLVEWMRENEPV